MYFWNGKGGVGNGGRLGGWGGERVNGIFLPVVKNIHYFKRDPLCHHNTSTFNK